VNVLDWLNIARNQAEERFRSLPFPTGKDENFRFTPLSYQETESAVTPTGVGVMPEALKSLEEGEASLLVLEGEDASLKGAAPGLLFTDILRAATLGSESIRTRLRDPEIFKDDKFAQLTAARWKNGAFLHVPAGVRLPHPVRFVLGAESAEEHFRNLIILEQGAEAVVIQECWSGEQARFVGELTEVRLGRGSRLHWIVLQQLGAHTDYVVRQKIDLMEGADLRFTPLHVGGKTVQTRQETHLGQGSLLDTQGAARGDGQQHFDFWLDVRHEGSRSRSAMDYWYVMADKAKGVFNAQVEVKRDALECESSQRSKTLLLGSGSVHAIPKLIIKTDAVKAAHGASVSSVNFEQLHYLQSRGIPRKEAESMIVRGFTEVVVDRFPLPGIQARAEALLDAKHGGGA
jgi:Fe-S cluster assembly protein SufD